MTLFLVIFGLTFAIAIAWRLRAGSKARGKMSAFVYDVGPLSGD